MTFINLKFDSIDHKIPITVTDDLNAIAFANNINQYTTPADYINQHNQSKKSIVDEFLAKAVKGKQMFNFEWDLNDLSQDNFNKMHRDIENFATNNRADDSTFKFFINLHEDLHKAERAISNLSQPDWNLSPTLQLKWFGPSTPWLSQPKFIHRSELQPGDVIAGYPHVGKTPLNTMKNNDVSTLETMCKIPDAYPPSLHIILANTMSVKEDNRLKDQLSKWYDNHSSRLMNLFTKEQMLMYYGEFKIGTISLDDVEILKKSLITSCSIVNY